MFMLLSIISLLYDQKLNKWYCHLVALPPEPKIARRSNKRSNGTNTVSYWYEQKLDEGSNGYFTRRRWGRIVVKSGNEPFSVDDYYNIGLLKNTQTFGSYDVCVSLSLTSSTYTNTPSLSLSLSFSLSFFPYPSFPRQKRLWGLLLPQSIILLIKNQLSFNIIFKKKLRIASYSQALGWLHLGRVFSMLQVEWLSIFTAQ